MIEEEREETIDDVDDVDDVDVVDVDVVDDDVDDVDSCCFMFSGSITNDCCRTTELPNCQRVRTANKEDLGLVGALFRWVSTARIF